MTNGLPLSRSNSLGVSGAMKPYQFYRCTLGGLAIAMFSPTLNKEAVMRVNMRTLFIGLLHATGQSPLASTESMRAQYKRIKLSFI